MQTYLCKTPYQLTLVDNKGEHQFSSVDIIRLQAADNYTIVYFKKGRPFIVSKVLKTYEHLLAPYGFIRTHRSHLVNRNYIQRIENSFIIMQDASVAEITRRKKSEVIRQLHKSSTKIILSIVL